MSVSAPGRIVSSPLQEEAKHPVTPIAGPYGHPFHPILVTIPIGAWVSSLAFDIAAHYSGEPRVFVKGAFWLVGLGIAGALVAALFGLLDLVAIPRGTRAFRTGLTHMLLNLAVVGVFAVSFLVRRGHLEDGEARGLAVALSIAGLLVLTVSGWLGGKLTYRYGVRVVNDQAQLDGYKTDTIDLR